MYIVKIIIYLNTPFFVINLIHLPLPKEILCSYGRVVAGTEIPNLSDS
jgi:hypothetical protein